MKQIIKTFSIGLLFSASLCSAYLSDTDKETIRQWAQKEFAQASSEARRVIADEVKGQVAINRKLFTLCQFAQKNPDDVEGQYKQAQELQELVKKNRIKHGSYSNELQEEIVAVSLPLVAVEGKLMNGLLENMAQENQCKGFADFLEYLTYISETMEQK